MATVAKEDEAGPWVWWLSAVSVAAATLLTVWLPAVLPFMDLPIHALFAQIVAGAIEDPSGWRVLPSWTSQGFVYLAAAFAWAGPVVGAKCAATVLIFSAFGAVAWALKARSGERQIGLLLAGPAVIGFCLSMGFLNYLLGLVVGVVAVGSAARLPERPRRAAMAAAVALVISAFCHIVAAAFALAQVVLIGLHHDRWRPGRFTVAACAATLPAAGYILLVLGLAYADYTSAGIVATTPMERLPILEQLLGPIQLGFGGFTSLGALGLLAFVLALRGVDSAQRKLVMATVLLWSAAYLAMPFHGFGWAYAQPRPVVAGLLFVAALSGGRPARHFETVAVAALSCAYLVSFAFGASASGEQVARIVAELGDASPGRAAVASLDPIRPSSSRYIEPGRHLGAYAFVHGGRTNTFFGYSRTIHSVKPVRPEEGWGLRIQQNIGDMFDCARWHGCAEAPQQIADTIALVASTQESVVVTGHQPGLPALLFERGLRAVPGAAPLHSESHASVLRLVPTSLRLQLRGDQVGGEHHVIVQVGVDDSSPPFVSVERRPGDPPISSASLDGLPAGTVFVSVVVDDEVQARQRVSLQPGVNDLILSL